MQEKEDSLGYASFLDGVKACLPTVLGYIGIGIAAGVVGKSSGLSVWEIGLLSTIVYAGSAQFIICGMLLISSPFSAIIFTTFLVNLRHFLMSMSVANYFKESSLLKSVGVGTLLTDESYGVLMTALQQGKKVSVSWTNGLNVTAYMAWILATVVGGIIGNWLPNPESFGLDFALTAMFIGLIILQVDLPLKTHTKQTIAVLLTVIVAVYVLMIFLTPEMAVLIATLVGCGVGVKMKNADSL